nr:hypothetical protein [Brevibacillus laterosporus]
MVGLFQMVWAIRNSSLAHLPPKKRFIKKNRLAISFGVVTIHACDLSPPDWNRHSTSIG